MTIQEIYDLAVEMGMKADPRGEKIVTSVLEKRKKAHKDSTEKSKKYFDSETLTNPYSDSRILFGDPKTKVKKLLVGIDADASEVLMVDRLNEKGANIDLLISHHPDGHALSSLHEVMEMQVDMYAKAGVPVNVADAIMKERMSEVQRRFSPLNHAKTVDAAKIMGVPLMALHTIWDNMGNAFMEKYISSKTFDTAGEVLEAVQEIPEFIEAMKGKSGPSLVSGSPSSRAGKVVVTFTGGTNPSVKLYEHLAKAGVGTLVEMHIGEDALKKLRELHINVIDVGHMAADSIGANLFMDAIEARGVEVVPCSGFVRIKKKGLKMISVTELRAGTTYEEDGQLLMVVSYEHIKMGRGSANIKVKVKNLKTGSTLEKGYTNGAKVSNVAVLKKDLQFLYKDDSTAFFMDPATYEQVQMDLAKIEDNKYLKEGEEFNISILDGELLSVAMPSKMVFTVTETSPGTKGNSATNVFKDAVLENGIITKVPMFINIGEAIRIDTRTGAYTEKA